MQKSNMDCNAQDLDVWTQPRIYEEIHTLIMTQKSRSWAQSWIFLLDVVMSMWREFWFINWKIGLSINTVVINIIEWHILGVEENKRFSQTYIILTSSIFKTNQQQWRLAVFPYFVCLLVFHHNSKDYVQIFEG